MATLEKLLADLDLSKYKEKLAAEEIDLVALKALSESELAGLGLPLGARKKIYLALHGQGGAPAAAGGPAASSSPSGPTTPDVPITGLFKAAETGNVPRWDGQYLYEPLNGTRIYAVSYDHITVIAKGPNMSVEREIRVPAPDTSFDMNILAGWGDHLAVCYHDDNAAGILVYSLKTHQLKATHKINNRGDRHKGLVFVSEDRLVARVYTDNQKEEVWLIDANTGEPLNRHSWGTNGITHIAHAPELYSSPRVPNVYWHLLPDKINVYDVTKSLSEPTQVWLGIPSPMTTLHFDNVGWAGAYRVTLAGGWDKREVQVWDMIKGVKLYSLATEYCLQVAASYRNVLISTKGDGSAGVSHIFDLTKIKPEANGVITAQPTRTVAGSGAHHDVVAGGYSFDDKHAYVGHLIIQWN